MDLEDFTTIDTISPGPDAHQLSQSQLDAARSAGYEDGYKAGWKDAIQAETQSQTHIGAEFARNLQEISFTFHEARSQMIKSFEPFLGEVVQKLLPKMAQASLPPTILEELLPLIEETADAPITITVAPGCQGAIEKCLTESAINNFEVVEEPTLADGQAFLRVGKTEKNIDLTQITDRVTEAITALKALNEKALKYG